MPPKTRAVGYVRVSTQSQVEEGRSLAEQEQAIRDYAEQNGLELNLSFRDEGESGKDLERPQLSALRELVRQGDADVVVTRNIDRLTRRGTDLEVLLDEFQENDVYVVTTHDRFGGEPGLDSRKDGKAFALTVAFARWQRERTSNATKPSFDSLRDDGRAFNRDLYGFDRTSSGELVVNPQEFAVLRQMRDHAARGASANEIARKLNDAGSTGKRGSRWYPKTVEDQLRLMQERPEQYEAGLGHAEG